MGGEVLKNFAQDGHKLETGSSTEKKGREGRKESLKKNGITGVLK